MSIRCRLLIDAPERGVWNMAVDEALLESAAEESCDFVTLRFYRWSEPTLSLGYFQSYEDRSNHSASRSLPVVRRSSGGGALIHDHEWTYSLAIPAAVPLEKDPVELTCKVHHALRDALIEMGADGARISLCQPPKNEKNSVEPFLCFQRRSRGDLLIQESNVSNWHKICGSAQRKRRGAVLQHGGALISQSFNAPELPGIEQLLEMEDREIEIATTWKRKLLKSLDLEPFDLGLSDSEKTLATEIMTNKFQSSEWTKRR